MNVILFANKMLANAIKLRISEWDLPEFRVEPKCNHHHRCTYKRKEREIWYTQGRTPHKEHKDGGIDSNYEAPSWGTSGVSGGHLKLEEKFGRDSPSVPQEGINTVNTLTVDCERTNFCFLCCLVSDYLLQQP